MALPKVYAFLLFSLFFLQLFDHSHAMLPFDFIKHLAGWKKGVPMPGLDLLKKFLEHFGYINPGGDGDNGGKGGDGNNGGGGGEGNNGGRGGDGGRGGNGGGGGGGGNNGGRGGGGGGDGNNGGRGGDGNNGGRGGGGGGGNNGGRGGGDGDGDNGSGRGGDGNNGGRGGGGNNGGRGGDGNNGGNGGKCGRCKGGDGDDGGRDQSDAPHYSKQDHGNGPHYSNDLHDVLESGIKSYQLNYNLKVTGVLDAETVSLMASPRCGLPDIINGTTSMRSGTTKMKTSGHRKIISHYVIPPKGSKWPSTDLTYAFFPNTPAEAMAPIAQAFEQWANATNLFKFERVQNTEGSKIKIGFERGDHGDGIPFDGLSGTIAHAFMPTNGQFHFDADEKWSVTPTPDKFHYESIALHEIGHLLGLGHSSVKNAAMYPYNGANEVKHLQADDLARIKDLYG